MSTPRLTFDLSRLFPNPRGPFRTEDDRVLIEIDRENHMYLNRPALRYTNGVLRLAVTWKDKTIGYRERSPSGWGDWTNLGGTNGSAPAVTSWDDGDTFVEVFAVGSDRQIWSRVRTRDGWTDWNSAVGGDSRSGLTASAHAVGSRSVFVNGADGNVWFRRIWTSQAESNRLSYIDYHWGNWERMPAPDEETFGKVKFISSPSLYDVASNPGPAATIYAVGVVGGQRAVYSCTVLGPKGLNAKDVGWEPWKRHDQAFYSSLAIGPGLKQAGDVNVFGVDGDGNLGMLEFNQGVVTSRSLGGGPLISAPAALVPTLGDGTNVNEVFAIRHDGKLCRWSGDAHRDFGWDVVSW